MPLRPDYILLSFALALITGLISPRAAAQDSSAVETVPEEQVEVARAAIDWVRDNYFARASRAPDRHTFRIDREAVAIVEPADNPEFSGGRSAARAHARAVADAMGVPYDRSEAFLDCTDPEPGQLRKCSFRRGIESYFRFDKLRLRNAEAHVRVVWMFIYERDLTYRSFTLRLVRANDTWSVREVLRREIE